ncbi:MAG: sensor histidine kinase [Actinomycetota bacterium]
MLTTDRLGGEARPTEVLNRDRLETNLSYMVLAARVTLVMSGILLGVLDTRDATFRTVAVVLIVWTLIASALQIRMPGGRGLRAVILVEPIITIGAVAATGGFGSEFTLLPAISLILVGYFVSRRPFVALVVVGISSVAITSWFQILDTQSGNADIQFAFLYLLCGAFGTLARRLVGELDAKQAEVSDQAGQMSAVNDLLVSLHGLVQTLPAALDSGEAVTSIRDRLRGRFRFHGLVILVPAEAGSGWRCELAEGLNVARRLTDDQLPAAARHALATASVVTVTDRLAGDEPEGFSALCRSGIYAPLTTRGTISGLLALEHDPPGVYGAVEAEFLDSFSSVFALTLDNARWFARLRALGAEAERSRIARELHDRIAQSLAYIAFELERLESLPGDKQAELSDLREVVRSVVGELRETIYQLRTSVTEDGDLGGLVDEFLARFGERFGIETSLTIDVAGRLAPRTEQELWRIIQEALNNIAKHADAGSVSVALRIGSEGTAVEISDDGRGFDPAGVHGEHYGIIGMRERAEAIGAQLAVVSRPGAGTTVRVEIPGEPVPIPSRIALPALPVQP